MKTLEGRHDLSNSTCVYGVCFHEYDVRYHEGRPHIPTIPVPCRQDRARSWFDRINLTPTSPHDEHGILNIDIVWPVITPGVGEHEEFPVPPVTLPDAVG